MTRVTGGGFAGVLHPFEAPPAEGEAVELADGVLWLRLPLPMKLDHVNCFALAEDAAQGGGWTIIDTGFSSRRGKAIWQALLAGPLAGRRVGRVIATHHHADHIGLAGWFQHQGAELWTSRTAWLFARMLRLDEQPLPVPQQVDFWRKAGMDTALLARRMAERPFNAADVVHALPLGYRRLVEGQTLRMGGRDWVVRMGNGHAPEHVTLWDQSDDLVIGGDQLLPRISPNLGVYPTEPLADPVGEWMESCARLMPHAREGQLVLPGHNMPFTGLPGRLRQMHDNHVTALDRLAGSLAENPRPAAACFDVLYKRRIGDGEYGLALVEAVGHVNHLFHQGRVVPAGLTAEGAVIWQGTPR